MPNGAAPGGSIPGGTTPSGSASGSQAPGGNPSGLPSSGTGGNAAASGQGALEQALEAFDGEILAERSVIAERSNRGAAGTGGGVPQPAPAKPSAGGGGKAASPGARTSRAPRSAPAMPGSGGGRSADGVPDAKDDDIIARQLREAAMAEQDPVLREKLWAEYERYKGR